MTAPEQPQEPEVDPHWSFSPDHDLKCPDCDAKVSGLNWVSDGTHTTGMSLIPCGHELPTSRWELKFSGRDRVMGTIIRTPKFVQKP